MYAYAELLGRKLSLWLSLYRVRTLALPSSLAQRVAKNGSNVSIPNKKLNAKLDTVICKAFLCTSVILYETRRVEWRGAEPSRVQARPLMCHSLDFSGTLNDGRFVR
jgi:hypothetical protein